MWNAVGESPPRQQIISSPMQRCHAVAKQLTSKHQLPVTIDERFTEAGFGSWEGRSRSQIKQNNLNEYNDFYRDPIHCRPTGAEPIDQFILRVSTAYDEISQQFSGQHNLLITHAGVIRAIVAHVIHASPMGLYRIQVKNAGISRICHNKFGAMLVFHNQ